MRAAMRNVCGAVLMAAMLVSGGAQIQARGEAQEKPAAPVVPLKVTVTVSRWQGEKKTASLPFVMWVNTGGNATVQMGTDVPVPEVSIEKKGETSVPVQSYRYRSLGTNITCAASVAGDGLYQLRVDVNDTQVFRGNDPTATPMNAVYQNFRSSNSPMLRDGQTVQFAVATDKTSGEVIKLDVALALVK